MRVTFPENWGRRHKCEGATRANISNSLFAKLSVSAKLGMNKVLGITINPVFGWAIIFRK